MIEFSSTMVREEAKFIPATMKRVQHIEHVYECKTCKKDATQKAQIKRRSRRLASTALYIDEATINGEGCATCR